LREKCSIILNLGILLSAFLEEVPKDGETLKFKGSAMIARAGSKEEVIEVLRNDIYSTLLQYLCLYLI
jgi:hypothetical protein